MNSKRNKKEIGLLLTVTTVTPILLLTVGANAENEMKPFSVEAVSKKGNNVFKAAVGDYRSAALPEAPEEGGGEAVYSKVIAKTAAGSSFTVALADDGTVYSFGVNNNGVLEQPGVTGQLKKPTRVEGVPKIKEISANNEGVLALA